MNAYARLIIDLACQAIEARDFAQAELLVKLIAGGTWETAHVLYVLGHAQIAPRRFAEAAAALAVSLAIDPDQPSARNDYAVALYGLERDAEAAAEIRRALAQRPDFPEAMETHAVTLLRAGNFRDGWPLYEARLRTRYMAHLARGFVQPQWRGEDIAGRVILLHCEQGIGDVLQFARYAPLVAERGATVVLEVYPETMGVLRGLPGIARIVPRAQPLPPFDVHCPVMSLPLAFGTDLVSIPAEVPYLVTDPHRIAVWRARLGPRTGLRIGLVASGNPGHPDDERRSIPLARLTRGLPAPNGCTYHLLQDAVRASDRDALSALPGLRDHGAGLRDFSDTAALVVLMDLVISVDTAVAHLAGGLGWPVWTLLPSHADWRWLTGRDDSPWYPTMRLFRQTRSGDWDGVLDRVAQALRDVLT